METLLKTLCLRLAVNYEICMETLLKTLCLRLAVNYEKLILLALWKKDEMSRKH